MSRNSTPYQILGATGDGTERFVPVVKFIFSLSWKIAIGMLVCVTK